MYAGVNTVGLDAGATEILTNPSNTGLSTATIRPTSGVYQGMSAKAALITCSAVTNFRLDGGDPSTTCLTLAINTPLMIYGANCVAGLRFKVTGTVGVTTFF